MNLPHSDLTITDIKISDNNASLFVESQEHSLPSLTKNSFFFLEPRKYIKSIIYGGLDGIITMFSIVSSSSGASMQPSLLLIIGIANLLADALSMSVSDYLSSKAELDVEKSK